MQHRPRDVSLRSAELSASFETFKIQHGRACGVKATSVGSGATTFARLLIVHDEELLRPEDEWDWQNDELQECDIGPGAVDTRAARLSGARPTASTFDLCHVLCVRCVGPARVTAALAHVALPMVMHSIAQVAPVRLSIIANAGSPRILRCGQGQEGERPGQGQDRG